MVISHQLEPQYFSFFEFKCMTAAQFVEQRAIFARVKLLTMLVLQFWKRKQLSIACYRTNQTSACYTLAFTEKETPGFSWFVIVQALEKNVACQVLPLHYWVSACVRVSTVFFKSLSLSWIRKSRPPVFIIYLADHKKRSMDIYERSLYNWKIQRLHWKGPMWEYTELLERIFIYPILNLK